MKQEECNAPKGPCKFQRVECEKQCCCTCKYGRDMKCSSVCPKAAGIMFPETMVFDYHR